MAPDPGPGEVHPRVTVVVPTLAADETLSDCLESLDNQTFSDFEVIVVDNSGRRAVTPRGRVRVIANDRNVGFGAAVNQAFRDSRAPFLAVLNDDATAHPHWLEALLAAIEPRPDVGMCAPQIGLAGDGRLDSAGMLLCLDGSSKQRGHLESPDSYARPQEALLPSGCAAFYRREMLEEIGLFDESFFLYCEDTDLGLRARWAAWECLYVPDAVVEHRYSHSAGKASALKAYYVERNRLFLVVKNFPMPDLLLAPFYSLARYFWHAVLAMQGRGKAAEFQRAGNPGSRLALYVLRANLELVRRFPALWKQRRLRKQRLTTKQFRRLIRRFSISPRQVAAL
ncbi:MAG: glycosyltransferase family 2 protein [Acidobacteriia bacterium]|nr:glycosyltransferase family 2 protein [Terriglobia bacterium]